MVLMAVTYYLSNLTRQIFNEKLANLCNVTSRENKLEIFPCLKVDSLYDPELTEAVSSELFGIVFDENRSANFFLSDSMLCKFDKYFWKKLKIRNFVTAD